MRLKNQPRYYFPRREEFHDGINYVVLPPDEAEDTGYSYLTYHMGDDINDLLNARRIKIRHLDVDDLIMLNLQPASMLPEGSDVTEWLYTSDSYKKDFQFKFDEGRGYLKIKYGPSVLYAGYCRNVNEFRRLCSNLGIELRPDGRKADTHVAGAAKDY